MNRARASTLACLLTVCCGCSGRQATYPASGTVRFDDGEPVRVGFVEFRCEENGLSARARLDQNGAFTLGTFSDSDGAPAGAYKVVIAQYFSPPPRDHAHEHEGEDHRRINHQHDARVARKFSDFATSPLRATVTPGAENKFHLKVTHPK